MQWIAEYDRVRKGPMGEEERAGFLAWLEGLRDPYETG
jgi:hypothetical protein